VGEARRAAVRLAAALGFSETEQGTAALITTEAATNLARHARDGELILRSLHPVEGGGLEVLAVDRGPGMADVGKCLADGYSTGGTPGHGLGALRRLSDVFDLYSTAGAGTALVARIQPGRPTAGLTLGAVCLPVAREEACGDAWALFTDSGRAMFLVADGLGHGPQAATAAQAAVRILRDHPGRPPAEVLTRAHAALRGTRGAAVAVATLDPAARSVTFAGVGNVGGAIRGPAGSQSMVSHNGTVGHELRKVHEFTYVWPPGSLIVLQTDGLGTHWDLDKHPGLAARHPAVIAGVLYRDHRRVRDDVTVLVIREA
jgi:anti-sigma regulatory factor (Ser/Thr protein kinase)